MKSVLPLLILGAEASHRGPAVRLGSPGAPAPAYPDDKSPTSAPRRWPGGGGLRSRA
jgi:hypothetical protein